MSLLAILFLRRHYLPDMDKGTDTLQDLISRVTSICIHQAVTSRITEVLLHRFQEIGWKRSPLALLPFSRK